MNRKLHVVVRPDCPPRSGAWFDVVFETYACTPDALDKLKNTAKQ